MLTKRENIFLAKKVFVELIHNAAYIEGCNVTFPQTQTILDGAVVNGITVDDIQTVLNLCDAWKYCIETIDEEFTLDYVCKLNEYVSRNESLEWGTLRKGKVRVGKFSPCIPVQEDVLNKFEQIRQMADPIERALEYFAYACKQKLFWDGNIRTSTIACNKILIEAGEGVLTIGKDQEKEFNEALNNWYLNNELFSLKECLKKCIYILEMQ